MDHMTFAQAVGQLRHLYTQMLASAVRDQPAAARGLLEPAIAEVERRLSTDAAELVEMRRARALLEMQLEQEKKLTGTLEDVIREAVHHKGKA